MENLGCIKEEWATYYKDQTFNIGETTNNRLESTFFFLIVTFTLHLNVKKLQSPGNLN